MKGYNRLIFRLMAVLLTAALTVPMDMPGARAAEAGRQAYLKMKLAARTGPGTWYDEPGSFFINDYKSAWVNVLSKAWDTSCPIQKAPREAYSSSVDISSEKKGSPIMPTTM